MYLFVQNKNNPSDAVCFINKEIAGKDISTSGWNWDFDIPNYDIRITPRGITLKTQTKEYVLFGSYNSELSDIISMLAYTNYTVNGNTEHVYWFGLGYNHRGDANPQFIDAWGISKGHVFPKYITTTTINNASANPNTDDDGNQETDGIIIINEDVNKRTLTPKQVYNFFIHYIRKDGSYTPGYNIGKASYAITGNNKLIVPKFENITKPDNDDYVGYFISYERVERNIEELYALFKDGLSLFVTNCLYIYDIDNIHIGTLQQEQQSSTINSENVQYIEDRLNCNRIKIIDNNSLTSGLLWSSYTINQYLNNSKVLFRLTPNCYNWGDANSNAEISSAEYLPDYYNVQHIIYYTLRDEQNNTYSLDYTKFIIDPANTIVLGINENFNNELNPVQNKVAYTVRYAEQTMYCKYPTEAMNIKDDFIRVAATLDWYEGTGTDREEHTELVVNSVISPDKLHDFLELQPAYRAEPSKSFTNYRKDNISRFDKTVYRSDVCSDESLVNGFRHFEPNNYKNILENKGKITNIVGIGLYLLIHTEYSLFVFDRSPKLTQRSQLDIPDAFDIDYQEVMPSNEGFGGLANSDESIVTKNGYIWLDKTNKYIFKYENGQAEILSGDINNFLKTLDINTVRFAEDINNNRLIICLYVNINDDVKTITISYSFLTKTFISFHDYAFTNNYRTYNKSYLVTDTHKNKLYEFSDAHTAYYSDLSKPCYTIDTIANGASFVDIIFNEHYTVPKSLNSIGYVLYEIINDFPIYKVSEEELNRRYSGYRLQIYTDETDTKELDITTTDVNTSDWTKPVWDKSKWLFNYFRNKNYITPTGPTDVVPLISDTRALIYGKYIIARFIFDDNKRYKLESISFNVNPY